ncbi:hypothetical protein GCM10022408_11530 [Hymenobacter fastidiosus]|uniref:Type I-C CRISPR-associated protein Cas8c/Csd1 n=1 Tax=Hymenobacter fastidiosus TaxID=486264 RepID=A0ABP7RTD7_9BACT
MLQTLLKLGQQGSQNRGAWDDLLKFPAVETSIQKKEVVTQITNYCLPVQFDLDAGTVSVGDLREHHEDSPREWFNLAVGGGNNPSVYVCVDGRKNMGQFTKTFFGKNAAAQKGELLGELAKARQPETSALAEALRRILPLRTAFEALAMDEKGDVSLKKLSSGCTLRTMDRVVLVYATVKCAELGWPEFRPFVRVRDGEMDAVPGYAEFVAARFQPEAAAGVGGSQLCYATGMHQEDVGELDIRERYSLNKMFVTTTLHYAPNFAKSDFAGNYQVSGAAQQLLERGSKMLLERYKVRIAGIDHCLLPKLLSTDPAAIESKLPRLSRKADLLFQYKKVDALTDELEEDTDLYWITFLGFESDGNFFKTINLIEDVSQTYFSELALAFQRLDTTWRQAPELPWGKVMGQMYFNLYSVYGLVPVRKDKEKRNAALLLFKQILERRPVVRRRLFEHFRELILCHRYRRYPAYGNVYDNNQNDTLSGAQAFDYAARNAVYQYLALFQILTQFQLLSPMDETQTVPSETEASEPLQEISEYKQKVESFFQRTRYTPAQKALFYLGRALAVVAYEQLKKKYESKPVLNKLNYSGMDKPAIIRLRNDLADKSRQFNLHRFMEPLFADFHRYFEEVNDWKMTPEESLFFILSGYTFSTK